MAKLDPPHPVGDGEHVVEQGECMGSIAYEHGFLEQTLWNHPKNENLAIGRHDRRVLLPGDRVHIPALLLREEIRPTDKKHVFVRKGIPEVLRMVLRDEDGNPRRSLRYRVIVDRKEVKSGVSGADGIIEAPIPPNARVGELVVTGEEAEEWYRLDLGWIDPATTHKGVQARLNNLGFFCGEVDGIVGHQTQGAIREFQESQNLPVTGKPDDDTRDALVRAHGF